MRSSIAILLLASCVSAVPAIYRRQDPSGSTIVPISTATDLITSLQGDASSAIESATSAIESATSMASDAASSAMESGSMSGDMSGDMDSGSMSESASMSMSGEPALPTASSVPLGINCPEGYTSGSYNVTRDLAGNAMLVTDQIGDFLNSTWQTQDTGAQQTGMTGLGNTVGATRTITVNSQELQETLTQYVQDDSTGAVNQTWILTNGPQDFGGEDATLVSYVQQLNLIPSEEEPDNSTIEWTTVFCVGEGGVELFQGFFQALHDPPLDALSNSTEALAEASQSSESAAAASTLSAAESLQSLAESASLAAVSLTAMPTSSAMMPEESGDFSIVTVTVTQ